MKISQVSQYKTWVEIDSRALLHNLRVVQKHVRKDVAVMCVVKSNAYGHGLIQVAWQLARYEIRDTKYKLWMGVDSIDEALALKKAGIKNPILILGYIPKVCLPDAIKNSFRFALYSRQTLKEAARVAKRLRKKAYIHIKLETGTYRQGIMPAELASFTALLKKYPHIVAEGVYTHFADTENASSMYYHDQEAVFEKGIEMLREFGIEPKFKHAAASAALLLHTETHHTMVRLGISLYGMYPSENIKHLVSNKLQLKPALIWKTRVAQVKQVPKGGTIGYDRTFTALQPMKVAILPVGYWDGYDRRLSNKGTVLIGGRRTSIVGNICMNIMMIDVTGIHRVEEGDEVVLLGRQGSVEVTAEEIAAKIGTINYEVTTRVNSCIARILR